MRIFIYFILFASIVAFIMLICGMFSMIRINLKSTYSVASVLPEMVEEKMYNFCQNCKIVIYRDKVTITENVYSDGKAHIIIYPDICLSIAKNDFNETWSGCSKSFKELIFSPGNYYVKILNYEPISYSYENFFNGLIPILVILIFAIAIVLFMYTKWR